MTTKIIFYYFTQNNQLPEYLLQNIENSKKYADKVILLTNAEIEIQDVHIHKIKDYPIIPVDTQNPLWKYSITRFFAIRDFVIETKTKNVVHLEGDCILYTTVKKLKRFFDPERLAYPVDNVNRGIASIMFIPNHNAISEFCDFVLKLQKQGIILNDMEYLGFYKNKSYLPIEPEGSKDVFDAAAIGQILGGTHAIPDIPFVNETCYVDYSKYSIERKSDGYYIKDSKIHVLHIHSKKLFKFF